MRTLRVLSYHVILAIILICRIEVLTALDAKGANVCPDTVSVIVNVIHAKKCGIFGWSLYDCNEERSALAYKYSPDMRCCDGWTKSTDVSKDCDLPLCFKRPGDKGGTCANGGTCVSPDVCKCKHGFKLPDCKVDINECETGQSKCDHVCRNEIGSYTCGCFDDWTLHSDKHKCIPICYGRVGEFVGTCANGGKCLAPNMCECTSTYTGKYCSSHRALPPPPPPKPGKAECLVQNGGCEQVCLPEGGSHSCDCHPGFILHANNTCQDLDECNVDDIRCSHVCENIIGSYSCSCPGGYELEEDLHSCKDMDECEVFNGGCSKACVNEPGSYFCQCQDGYGLKADGKICWEFPYCIGEQTTGCLSPCHLEKSDDSCSCPGVSDVFILGYCIDICSTKPCPSRTHCKADPEEVFICHCGDSSVSDRDCDSLTTRFPAQVEVRRKKRSANITIRYPVLSKTKLWATADPWVEVSPNPVEFSPSQYEANITILIGKVGKFKIEFNTSSSENSDMEVISHDVFTRLKLEGRLLPSPCFNITVQNSVFTSTSQWYTLKSDSSVYFTMGIAYYMSRETFFPMSVDGLEIHNGTTITTRLPHLASSPQQGFLVTTGQKNCKALELFPLDIHELKQSRSMLRTINQRVKKHAPYWFSIDPIYDDSDDNSVANTESRLLLGSKMMDLAECAGYPIQPDILYQIFLFSDAFNFDILGQTLRFPSGQNTNDYCLITNFDPTLTIVVEFNPDNFGMTSNIDFIKIFYDESSIKVSLKGFGISDAWFYNDVFQSNNSAIFHNGAKLFQYPVSSKLQLYAALDAQHPFGVNNNTGTLFDYQMSSEIGCYVDADPDYFFTHAHITNREAYIKLSKMELVLRVRVMGINFDLDVRNVVLEQGCVVAYGGNDGDRTPCGRLSNPPGIFAKLFLNENLFKGFPVLSNLVLSTTNGFYFYKTFDDKKDQPDLWKLPMLINTKKVLQRRIAMLHRYVLNLLRAKGKMLHAETKSALVDLASIITLMSKKVDTFDYVNMTGMYFADFTRDITILGRQLDMRWQKLLDAQYLNFDLVLYKDVPILLKYQELITGHFHGLVWELYEGTIPYYPIQYTMGISAVLSFTVLGMVLTIKGQWTITDDSLMTCSEYFPYYDHIQGGKPTLLSGTLQNFYPSDDTLLERLWQNLQIMGGVQVSIAFSKTRPLFALKLKVFINLWCLSINVDLFITNKEIMFETTFILCLHFEIHLSLTVVIPDKLQDLSLYAKGRFLISEKNSLKDKLWNSMRQKVTSDQERLLKRVRNAKIEKNTYLLNYGKAADHLQSAKRNLDSTSETFKAATNKMKMAENQLEYARNHLEKAHIKTENRLKTEKVCSLVEKCSDFTCKLRNIACHALRALAVPTKYAMRVLLNVPIVLLQIAQRSVATARNLLTVAKEFYEEAKLVYEDSSSKENFWFRFISKGDKILTHLHEGLAKVYDVVTAFVKNTISDMFSLKNCGFLIELSVKNIFAFEVGCEVKFLNLAWSNMSFSLNMKDVSGSIYSVGTRLVSVLKKKRSTERRKRSSTFAEFVKGDDGILNDTNSIIVDSITWSKRCNYFTPAFEYLKTSVAVLTHLLLENARNKTAVERTLKSIEEDLSRALNFSINDLDLDFEVLADVFNVSRGSVGELISLVDLMNDPAIIAWRDLLEYKLNKTKAQLGNYVEYKPYEDMLNGMEVVPVPGDCFTFSDCLLWSLDEINELLTSVDPLLSNTHAEILEQLTTNFTMLLNPSFVANSDFYINVTCLQNLYEYFCGKVPVIVKHPMDVIVEVGNTAVLSCEAKNPTPSTIFWFKGDSLLVYGANTTQLKVNNVSLDDEGYYRCIVGNHIENVSSSVAELQVGLPPVFIDQFNATEKHYLGQTLQIQDRIIGHPVPLVSVISFPEFHNQNFSGTILMDTPGQFLMKYLASNFYRTIESSEILLKVYRVYPQCPIVWVTCALNIRPSVLEEYDTVEECGRLNLGGNNPTPRQCLQQKINQLLKMDNNLAFLKVMVFNDSDRTARIKMMINSTDYSGNNTGEADRFVQQLHIQLSETVRNLSTIVDTSVDLFLYNGYVYSMNPAYWKVHQGRRACSSGYLEREPHYCVEDLPRFILPAPNHLEAFTEDNRLKIRWDPPMYADSFVQEYTLTVDSDTDQNSFVVNISSTWTNASIESRHCGGKCQIYVSALTQSYKSEWATLPFNFHKEMSDDNSTLLGVSITFGVVVIAIAIGYLTRKKLKNRKIAPSDIKYDRHKFASAKQINPLKIVKFAWQESETDQLPLNRNSSSNKQLDRPHPSFSKKPVSLKITDTRHSLGSESQSVFTIPTSLTSYNIGRQCPNVSDIDDLTSNVRFQYLFEDHIGNSEDTVDPVLLYHAHPSVGAIPIHSAANNLDPLQLGTNHIDHAGDNNYHPGVLAVYHGDDNNDLPGILPTGHIEDISEISNSSTHFTHGTKKAEESEIGCAVLEDLDPYLVSNGDQSDSSAIPPGVILPSDVNNYETKNSK